MIPDIIQLYKSTVDGLASASRDHEFGYNLLVSGKSPRVSREDWLRDQVAESLRAKGFSVAVNRDRIDIAIWESDAPRPLSVIEAKFLYTHGTSFFCNVWLDFLKRYNYGVTQYAILFIGDYLTMPVSAAQNHLYGGASIAKLIDRERSNYPLLHHKITVEFKPLCQVHSDTAAWSVAYAGAVMSLHAVVLMLESGVSREELIEKFKRSTSPKDFEKRISKM